MSNNKELASLKTYDPNDDTATGWDATLYADGSVAMESRSRWSGSMDGERWRSDTGLVAVDLIDPNDPDHDAEAALTEVVRRFESSHAACRSLPETWRQTRRGTLVR